MSTAIIICTIVWVACAIVCFVCLYLAKKQTKVLDSQQLELDKQIAWAEALLMEAREKLAKAKETRAETKEKIKAAEALVHDTIEELRRRDAREFAIKKGLRQMQQKHPCKPTLYEFMPNTFTRRDVKNACKLNGIKSPYRTFIHKWLHKGMIEQVIDAAGCSYKKINHKN